MKSYVPNDLFFYELAQKYSKLRIIGFNPGPTKGTNLNLRSHSPIFFRLIDPIFRLVAKPVEKIGELFLNQIEAANLGLHFYSKNKSVKIPPFFTVAGLYHPFQKINIDITHQ